MQQFIFKHPKQSMKKTAENRTLSNHFQVPDQSPAAAAPTPSQLPPFLGEGGEKFSPSPPPLDTRSSPKSLLSTKAHTSLHTRVTVDSSFHPTATRVAAFRKKIANDILICQLRKNANLIRYYSQLRKMSTPYRSRLMRNYPHPLPGYSIPYKQVSTLAEIRQLRNPSPTSDRPVATLANR